MEKLALEAEKTGKAPTKEQLQRLTKCITLEIDVYQPYVDFLKDYLNFFGSTQTVEFLCMKMIYEETNKLYNELMNHISKQKGSLLDSSEFWKKYPYLNIEIVISSFNLFFSFFVSRLH